MARRSERRQARLATRGMLRAADEAVAKARAELDRARDLAPVFLDSPNAHLELAEIRRLEAVYAEAVVTRARVLARNLRRRGVAGPIPPKEKP